MFKFLSTIVFAMLILHSAHCGPVTYASCIGTCMSVAWIFSIPVVAATGGLAVPVIAAAYAGAGAGLTGQCAATCLPFLGAPSP